MIASRPATNRAIIHFNNIAIVPFLSCLNVQLCEWTCERLLFQISMLQTHSNDVFWDLQPQKITLINTLSYSFFILVGMVIL